MLSVISTVYNEGDNLHHLLESLSVQTCPADEIIIVDGGSTDNTVAVLMDYQQKLPLQVIVHAGANISEGRNIAFAASTGDIIAITDAGVRLSDDWLEQLIKPFHNDVVIGVSAGFFRADPHTMFEVAMGATVLPLENEIDTETFLPSSRSIAVRRDFFQQVEGYPEWLDYCEDLIFDLRLKALTTFSFAPNAQVAFRPRGNLQSFFKQYYLYARGDGKADLWRKRHMIRYITYLVVVPVIFGLGWQVNPLFWLLYVMGGFIYTRTPYHRLPSVMREYKKQSQTVSFMGWIQIILLVPLIRVVGDIAKMIGYPVGWWWRLQNNPPNWQL